MTECRFVITVYREAKMKYRIRYTKTQI